MRETPQATLQIVVGNRTAVKMHLGSEAASLLLRTGCTQVIVEHLPTHASYLLDPPARIPKYDISPLPADTSLR